MGDTINNWGINRDGQYVQRDLDETGLSENECKEQWEEMAVELRPILERNLDYQEINNITLNSTVFCASMAGDSLSAAVRDEQNLDRFNPCELFNDVIDNYCNHGTTKPCEFIEVEIDQPQSWGDWILYGCRSKRIIRRYAVSLTIDRERSTPRKEYVKLQIMTNIIDTHFKWFPQVKDVVIGGGIGAAIWKGFAYFGTELGFAGFAITPIGQAILFGAFAAFFISLVRQNMEMEKLIKLTPNPNRHRENNAVEGINFDIDNEAAERDSDTLQTLKEWKQENLQGLFDWLNENPDRLPIQSPFGDY